MTRRLLREKGIGYDEGILQSISGYIAGSRGNIFDIAGEDIVSDFTWNIHAWRTDGFKRRIEDYKKKTTLRFSQTEKQKETIRNYMNIYGETEDGKGMILTRINPKVLFREISYEKHKDYTAVRH